MSAGFLVSLTVQGQDKYFELGFEGGPNKSIIEGNEVVEVDHFYKSYFTCGIFTTYQFNKYFSMKSGIYYEGKGADIERRFNYPSGPADYVETSSENFEFITIPLLVRFDYGTKFKVFVNAGPYVSLLLKQHTHSDPTRYWPEMTQDGTDLYKSTEFGISSGFGLTYSFNGGIKLSLEVRDNLGLTDLNDRPNEFPYELTTNTINFLFAISYKLQKSKE